MATTTQAEIQAEAIFSIHFDGPITKDHMLTLRTIAKTYKHMQSAIDRAFLIEKYGQAWKHARLLREDYEQADFLARYPREGGIILDAISSAHVGARTLIDRISSALVAPFAKAFDGGLEESEKIASRLAEARGRAKNNQLLDIPTLQSLIENPPIEWSQGYNARAICKEIDQLVAPISSEALSGSIAELTLQGATKRMQFGFTSEIAARFHRVIASRELGPLAIVNAQIRQLDRGNKYSKPTAKIRNLDSRREATLHLESDSDFQDLHPYHTAQSVRLFVAPFLEFGGFDVHGGDLFYVGIAE